jgi:peptide/nickel transport system ATP-binding protein
MLDVAGLAVTYVGGSGPVPAVRDLDFTLQTNRRYGLVGESGSGKSSVVRALLGLVRPPHRVTATHLELEGAGDLSRMSPSQLRRLRGSAIGYVGQNPFGALHPVVSLSRQFEGFLRDHDAWRKHESPELIAATLRDLGIVDPQRILQGHAGALSGGMAQRVAIAIASLLRPKLLIADEPTTALDVTVQRQVLELIASPQIESGRTILLVTHDLAVVAQYCDEVIVMNRGAIVERGPVSQVLTCPNDPYTASLLAAVPRAQDPGDPRPRVSLALVPSPDAEPSLDPEPSLHTEPSLSEPARADAVLALEGVTKTYRSGATSVHAVRDVSLHIGRGETVALIGESGSGKSTLGRLALLLTQADAGRILLHGRDLQGLSPRAVRRLRPQMQIVFQEPYEALDPQLKAAQSVAEPLLNVRPRLDRAEIRRRVDEALELAGLEINRGDRYPQQLSGGEQQRVGIARAIITRPSFVVLDEPTSSLDLTVRAEILKQLQLLQTQLDMSYLFISHDLATARVIGDRVLVMYRGRIVESGPARSVFAFPAHPYTRLLNDACLDPDPRVAKTALPVVSEAAGPAGGVEACGFLSRCPAATDVCLTNPPLEPRGDGRAVACWHPIEMSAGSRRTDPADAVYPPTARSLGGRAR